MNSTIDPRIVVVGTGGIGGTIATRLNQHREITVVTNNPGISEAVMRAGLSLDDHATGEQLLARPHVVTHAQALRPGGFDVALVAVPPNRLADAVAQVLPALALSGVVVPLANGLPEAALVRAGVVPQERVIGCVVGFGASMLAPGKIERTSEGGLTLGTLASATQGPAADALVRLVDVLQRAIPTERTSNLEGVRWSKLAINSAISSLGTLGGDRLGALMRHRFVRRLCLDVMTEVVRVAQREHVRLEKVSGTLDLEWLALDDDEQRTSASASLFTKHAVMLAVGARYRRLRSSMLAGMERGREPPIAFLNGEVVARGEALGLSTPVNRAIVDAVWQVWRKESTSSLGTLQRLYDATRSGANAASATRASG